MTDHDWSDASVRMIVETCIDLYGPDRCFFGSNWPVDSLYGGTYTDLVDSYLRIIEQYSESEQEAMKYGNASRFYRF